MALVTETLDLPGGGSPTVAVQVTLAGEGGVPLLAGYDADGNTVVGLYQELAVDGVWSVDLPRNDQIIPAGTAWRIVLDGSHVRADPRYVTVTGPGPFEVRDILTAPPAAIEESSFAIHLAATDPHGDRAASQPLDADLTAIAGLDSATAGALATDGAGWIRKTYAQLKTALGLVKADVGLGNVDNTSDVDKPVSTAQQAALVPRSTLTTDGDLFTRTAGAVARLTRAALAADPAFTGVFVPKATFPVLIGVALSDETTAITVGAGKAYIHAPFAFTLTAVKAELNTVSSSGAVTVDINEGAGAGTSVLSTKLTIDQSEETSATAATPAVISDSAIADDARLSFDIDGAGTGAKGLKVWLYGTRVLP